MGVSDTSARFCHQCGASAAIGDNFCQQCGTKFRKKAAISENGNASMQVMRGNTPLDLRAALEIKPNGSFLGHAVAFFICYVMAAIPTYILPYFGSNSTIANSFSTAADNGLMTTFWLHVAALYVLVVLAWFRGALIGRSWLPALPVIAGIFDLAPGLNWIPLVPTAFHVTTLFMGVSQEADWGRNIGSKRLIGSACGLFLILLVGFFEAPKLTLDEQSKMSGAKPASITGMWAFADTGCGTGYGATYTAGGKFAEGDEFSGVEGRWAVKDGRLERETKLQYIEDISDERTTRPIIKAKHQIDHFQIDKLTATELVIRDNREQKFAYVRCSEGQRTFSDGEIATSS